VVAVAQVVVANCGGGKLWSRAGVRVVERGSRKKASGGISGSLLQATRESYRGRVPYSGEVVEREARRGGTLASVERSSV